MSTAWLLSTHDIEIAADIEREIARIERPGGRIGGRFRINCVFLCVTLSPLLVRAMRCNNGRHNDDVT